MQKNIDVIVAGAGPAGSMAAIALAQKGYQVLILDKNQFPREKTCGDGLPARTLRFLYEFGMEEALKNAVFYPIHGGKTVSPGAIASLLDQQGVAYTMPRMQFDDMLQKHAIASGAQFVQAHVNTPLLKNENVIGVRATLENRKQNFFAKAVIAADGANSPIAKAMGIKNKPGNMVLALRGYMSDFEVLPHRFEFFCTQKKILPGYIWIFPIAPNIANIGIGAEITTIKRKNLNLKTILQRFLAQPEIQKRMKSGNTLQNFSGGKLPLASKTAQRAFNGLLVAGDASGVAHPVTGEGVHNALKSGFWAAQTLHLAFAKNDFSVHNLRQYEKLCYEKLKPEIKVGNWLKTMGRFPFLIDWGIRLANINPEFTRKMAKKI